MRATINVIRKGTILLWSGSVASIPGGWVLCNGSNGTPDLRDNFVRGAGFSYNPDDTGGTTIHSHVADETHWHVLGNAAYINEKGDTYDITTGTPPKGGVTANAATIPPFLALAYIMKV